MHVIGRTNTTFPSLSACSRPPISWIARPFPTQNTSAKSWVWTRIAEETGDSERCDSRRLPR
jgi:hypothetical protein